MTLSDLILFLKGYLHLVFVAPSCSHKITHTFFDHADMIVASLIQRYITFLLDMES